MDFAHYTDDPVNLAVDLVNTHGWVSGTEGIARPEDLARFVSEHAGHWAPAVPPVRRDDVERVRRLRTRLRGVFEAQDVDAAATEINAILSDSGATPSLSTHGDAPHLHFEPGDGSAADWLGVVTAMGLATVIAEHGLDRLGVCQSDSCADAYIDTSRNRSRRHCSSTCRTRENVAAHRQRRRSE